MSQHHQQTALEQFKALIEEKARANRALTRTRVVSAVARENPELHQRVIDEANERP